MPKTCRLCISSNVSLQMGQACVVCFCPSLPAGTMMEIDRRAHQRRRLSEISITKLSTPLRPVASAPLSPYPAWPSSTHPSPRFFSMPSRIRRRLRTRRPKAIVPSKLDARPSQYVSWCLSAPELTPLASPRVDRQCLVARAECFIDYVSD